MKNLCLIILSLFLVNTLFAQTKKTKSSISISHEEKSFSLDARFSSSINGEIKDAIIEEVSRVLGEDPEVNSKDAYVWEEATIDDPNYVFRLSKKRCKIKIKKKGLNRNQFDRLCELGEEVGALLGEQSNSNAEIHHKPSCTKSKTETRTRTSSKSKSNGFLNLAIAGSDNGESTSVAISENKNTLDLSATFSAAMQEAIVEKIKTALGDDSTGDFAKQIWKDSKADGGYRIEIEDQSCQINLNKKTLSASNFEKLEKLCLDLANLISNGEN